jgi:methionyl aminopeptidase
MIICKTEHEVALMRSAGRIVAETHQMLTEQVKPGITTEELDRLAEEYIRKQNALPSFKGYGGFPASICTSVNEELVHGIPSDRVLKEGDIISIDIGAEYQGYHGDSAWTYGVGEISESAKKLLQATEESLYKGLAEAMPDERLSNISHAIEQHIALYDYSIVREYVGHGIGARLHEDPHIPNYGPPDRGPRLKIGMALAIEPMIIIGERFVRVLADGWTVVSVDNSLCAHFEHTIVITKDGHEIMTKL